MRALAAAGLPPQDPALVKAFLKAMAHGTKPLLHPTLTKVI